MGDGMIDLEKAARQALKSIETFLYCCVEKESDIQREPVLTDLDNAKTALRAALAQQAEPVWELGVAGRLSAEATALASREGRTKPEADHATQNCSNDTANDGGA